jgi:hypothetical protein
MSTLKSSKRTVTALALLFMFSLVLIVVSPTPPAEAQSCTDGATKWTSNGCCECNSGRLQTLWVCDNGFWVQVRTQCNTINGGCCSYPCCS